MKITPIIGLEVHVELKTKSKMFCGCNADHFHTDPNTHTCPVCLGLPGALPVPNKVACEWCIKLGLALQCQINQETFFERKNYFYPDLAKSYQITQLQKPFAVNGQLTIDDHVIRINRAHMEEDTGKSVHVNLSGEDSTLLDFNRSGVPLVEIVSEPDIVSGEEAKKYLGKLQQIIRYLGISDADIEKGSMRCEPTINVKIETDTGEVFYTPLVEVKNVASLSGVMSAIEFEVDRQVKQWQDEGVVKSVNNKTTRGWDADHSQTFLQREKEGSADYRYFPEPDIPPIIFSHEQIAQIKSTIPELPDEKISRFKEELGLGDYDSTQLVEDPLFASAFELALGGQKDKDFAKFCANSFLGPIKTNLNETAKSINQDKINPQHFKKIYDAVASGLISSSVAKQIIVESYLTGNDPIESATSQGLIQVSDSSQIENYAREVISNNQKAVDDYRKNPLAIGFLVGQLMKASKGSANPIIAKEVLEKILNN